MNTLLSKRTGIIVAISIVMVLSILDFGKAYKVESIQLNSIGEYSEKPLLGDIKKNAGKRELLNSFKFIQRGVGSGSLHWEVRKGLLTDCNSFPEYSKVVLRVISNIRPCDPDIMPASVVHDRYATAADRSVSIPYRTVHNMYYAALRANNVNKFKARLLWSAVRYFGPVWGHQVGSIDLSRSNVLEAQINMMLRAGEVPGAIYLDSYESTGPVNVKFKFHADTTNSRYLNEDWFVNYARWIKESINEDISLLQIYADACDMLSTVEKEYKYKDLDSYSRNYSFADVRRSSWLKSRVNVQEYLSELVKVGLINDNESKRLQNMFWKKFGEYGCPETWGRREI